MAEKRKSLGRGIGVLIPETQTEAKNSPLDVFFNQGMSKVSSFSTKLEPNSKSAVRKNNFDKKASEKTVSGAKKVKSTVKKTPISKNPKAKEANSGLVPVPGATFGDVPIKQIIPNAKQPRQIFDEDDLLELSASIKEVGVLQPIVIRPLNAPLAEYPDARYEIIMGERRWRASQEAGLTTIPAVVRRTEDADLLRDALLENLHRAELNALEEAAAYKQLLEDFACTQEELAKRIARSRPQISNTLRLLNLPPLVQRRVAAGVLSAGHARALLGLSDPAAMERLAQRIVSENLSVRNTEELVTLGDDTMRVSQTKRKVKPEVPEIKIAENQLENLLDTKVKITLGKLKGKITIDFASVEDLHRIMQIVNEEN